MGKFNPGDLVTIRKDLIKEVYYGGCYFASPMDKYLGKVSKIQENICDELYILEKRPFVWSIEMFEREEEKEMENMLEEKAK